MIRKPEPKEAAKAIAAMMKAKGITVTRSLALEVVAAVEGFNDWNTMAAFLANVQPAASAEEPTRSTKHPKVKNDDGPFVVEVDNGEYDTCERFSVAANLGTMFAQELDNSSVVNIYDARKILRATYVGDHSRFRLYTEDYRDTSVVNAQAHAKDYIETTGECTYFGHPENFYDAIVEAAETNIGEEGSTFIVGFREYDCDPETARVYEHDLKTPIRLALYIARGELRHVSWDLPKDIRERIQALVK